MREKTLNKLLISLFLLFFIQSCARSPQLNSDLIEERFGNYGVEILDATENRRISSLYSDDDGIRTTRTLAVVQFHQPVHEPLLTAHQEIVNGASIGKTIREFGWQVEKETLELCERQPTDNNRYGLAGMRLEGPTLLAVHRYRFLAVRGADTLEYAVITELHHPDYLTLPDLITLYAPEQDDYAKTDSSCLVLARPNYSSSAGIPGTAVLYGA